MAIGDAGAAKGLIIYPQTQAHGLGYQNDNQRADDIAAEIDARAAGDASVRAEVVAVGARVTNLTAAQVKNGTGTVAGDLAYLGNAVASIDQHIVNIYNVMRAHGWNV